MTVELQKIEVKGEKSCQGPKGSISGRGSYHRTDLTNKQRY